MVRGWYEGGTRVVRVGTISLSLSLFSLWPDLHPFGPVAVGDLGRSGHSIVFKHQSGSTDRATIERDARRVCGGWEWWG